MDQDPDPRACTILKYYKMWFFLVPLVLWKIVKIRNRISKNRITDPDPDSIYLRIHRIQIHSTALQEEAGGHKEISSILANQCPSNMFPNKLWRCKVSGEVFRIRKQYQKKSHQKGQNNKNKHIPERKRTSQNRIGTKRTRRNGKEQNETEKNGKVQNQLERNGSEQKGRDRIPPGAEWEDVMWLYSLAGHYPYTPPLQRYNGIKIHFLKSIR